MFRLLMPVPRTVFVAVSGGPDSMAVLSFLKNNHKVIAVHYNHGTEHGKEAEAFVVKAMKAMEIPLIVGRNYDEIPVGTSKEEFWRDKRYAFFKRAVGNQPLVMAHTLDDAMETWIFKSAHGRPNLIPPYRGNVLRPFLLCRKKELLDWCKYRNIPYVMDPGNYDNKYPRVRIRQVIMPSWLKINPGFPKTIRKKYIKEFL